MKNHDISIIQLLGGENKTKFKIYDFEVTEFDWLVVLLDTENETFTVIHNDNEAAREVFLDDDTVFVGFNSKAYDQFIVKGICLGMNNDEVKALNDYLISDHNGWEYPAFQGAYFRFNNCDIRDDMQAGLSLKAIEGHLGMPICESSVSFDIQRPLTEDELDEMIYYCKHDVRATYEIFKLRQDYLKTKMQIGRMAGLSDERSLSMTNAKLTAALLHAERKPHRDEREYVYPSNLLRKYIPQEVFDFFNRMKNPELSDEDVFKSKLKFQIGDCPGIIGYGGIHGALPNYEWDQARAKGRIIRNWDVSSYYPHLMTINGYVSRNIPSPKTFSDVLEKRMVAKATGDEATNKALKLIVNTTYGATLNQFNDLYDPLQARSVCISGQLYLMELAQHLFQDIPELRIVQLNTDGIMVEFDESFYGKVQDIVDEWQVRTGFELEEDSIVKIAQKDVNNYLEIQSGGKVKTKGGYLVRGIAPAGAFNINRNVVIVAEAVRELFANGQSPRDTIMSCDDIMKFQIIAKAGAKYREAYHMVNGEKVPVQKVNRVYATKDTRYGKIYKVKAENDQNAKIDSLPEHCIIDNDNQLTIDDIDKEWYIEVAEKRINDFRGIKPEKTTRKKVTKMKQSVYRRLANVREKFAAEGIKKTGKNSQLMAMYFTLDDIVPRAMRLFHEEGLLPCASFNDDVAMLTIYDMDDESKFILFTQPMRKWEGNKAVTPVQALGSTITYMRRYLYQCALDMVEVDEIEENTALYASGDIKKPAPAVEAPKPKMPLTPEQKEEVKKEITNADGPADALQIRQLKDQLKKVRAKDSAFDEFVAGVAVETQGFKVLTKVRWEELMAECKEKLS